MKNLGNSVAKQDAVGQSAKQKAPEQTKINSVTLVYVPIYLGGPHRGTSMGPAAMRVAGIRERIESMGFNIANEIEISVPQSLCWLDRSDSKPKCIPEIMQVSLELAVAVQAAMDAGTIPITIGGDHSIAIGSLAGVSSYYRKRHETFGCVWFDAHGDINTPETSGSGNVHGMPFAVSLGYGDKGLVDLLGHSPKVDAKLSALVGLRDIDPGERGMIEKSGVTAFSMRDIDYEGLSKVNELIAKTVAQGVDGIHVSFDLDVMDPDLAPGVSTPARGGLTYREASISLALLAETGLLRSIDIAELNPANDVRSRSAELAVDLTATCLGNRIL